MSSRFEATRQIRIIEELASKQSASGKESPNKIGKWYVPIFAMTADVIQATPAECQRCGMNGYISKPFEEEQLYKVVAKCLEIQSPTSA